MLLGGEEIDSMIEEDHGAEAAANFLWQPNIIMISLI